MRRPLSNFDGILVRGEAESKDGEIFEYVPIPMYNRLPKITGRNSSFSLASNICLYITNYLHFITMLSQMKHQLDAALCRFYFCRVTLHVSGASAHHQEYLTLQRGGI